MIDSRRRLPHWVPDEVPVFVTWRPAGSLPKTALKCQPDGTEGERFVGLDKELDRAVLGPTWLNDTRVAKMVVEALQYGAAMKEWYQLYAWVLMPNHVHVVWKPNIAMSRILQWIKAGTAYRAKDLLGLSAEAFWQAESYDHWIRSDRELQKIIRYVEWNPVKAGLAKSVEQWRWSSAYENRA